MNTVLSPNVDPSLHSVQHSAIPSPIFSLSNRLLAYASPPPKLESPLESPSRLPRTASQSSDDNALKFPTTQAELGSAAVKIGGSVLSGMKVLGGMAFTAARAGVSAAATAAERRYSTDANATAATPGKFFSRSAPAASGRDEQHHARTSVDATSDTIELPNDDKQGPVDVVHHVTVVDLASLIAPNAPQGPARVAEFLIGKDQPISQLQFSPDGTSLMVAMRGGHVMRVYQLRPTRRHPGSSMNEDVGLRSPWHVYDLRRGRTSAIVDSLTWEHDGRWAAVATEKGTVHIFATNPYGGPSDEKSHLDGRVINAREVQPLSTEIHPTVRLRVQRPQGPDTTTVPLAFMFIPQSMNLPSSLSSQHPHYQDTLLFDPRDGMLSLRRISLLKQTRERTTSTFGTVPLPGGTSISLPGVSTLSGAQAPAGTARTPSALTKMMARSTELVANENVVATWMLRRSKDWREIRRSLRTPQSWRRLAHVAKPDWIAQAELSTYSRSTRIVPRSLYLAHQFSFYILEEDYHGLLRSYNFDVPASKVEVRRQIEVNASGSSMSESFVSGSSLPSQSGFSTSFDEAVSADMRMLKPSPPVLPMYPNGPPRSYRNPIPIRNVAAGISDGMSEGLGRLRREIGKVRSPRLAPKRDSLLGLVPLEFDEEDEDFVLRVPASNADDRDDTMSRGTSREGASLSTPSTNIEPLPAEDDEDAVWEGWGPEDKQAVEEIEQFDDIAVGFMDEDTELVQPVRRR
ncbi:uncharacterized protein PHACADRAFT_248804 [Phanerochaete carnosa HHB-10118-sp]|uniref:BCAS3 WD40 domain-containing protein n=1 Tax=Phanerochaete carnosa (strain HHB-10118-sp) TaxID=650164 RepID=K5X798_PHACS|nr:uncharacterized protein PHACADRAFT_248804 [Phanerochaete carnosa HHB-10118-sp]EKM58747.1 hypothetical protein PHACADRAFT_248804 [Phanerochaete carnosa HHB-10118-sp]